MKTACSLVIVAIVLTFHNVAPSFYNCGRGPFYTLNKLTEQCRYTSYVPSLRALMKKGGHVMGEQLSDMVDSYCRLTDTVNVCVEDMIAMLPCLRDQQENYQTMISTSNWMCKTEVKEQIKQKLSAIPRIEVNPRAQCYRQAARKSYTCVKRYVDHRHLEPSQKAKTVMASLPCTYDALKDICPQGEALFYTILNYDWLVLPPALGVNVSDTLLRI